MNQSVIYLHSSAVSANVPYSLPASRYITKTASVTYSVSVGGNTFSVTKTGWDDEPTDDNSLPTLLVSASNANSEVICSVTVNGSLKSDYTEVSFHIPGLDEDEDVVVSASDLSSGSWSASGQPMTLTELLESETFDMYSRWDYAMVMEFEVGDGTILQLNTSGDSTDVYVDWGDSSVVTHHTGNEQPSHTYASAGTYDVRMIGTVSGLVSPNPSFRSSLRRVKSWGRLDGLSNMTSGFTNCTGLTEITADTDGTFENVTDFSYCFYQCSGLTSIPDGLFDNSPKVTDFSYCFQNCAGLTSIPDGLFANCPDVMNFNRCFNDCRSLASIPDGLFDNCQRVTDFSYCFSDCRSLASIPDGLFDNCPKVTNFSGCFYQCSVLVSIPAGLFDNCPNVKNFSSCFSNCKNIASIPNGLFDNCPDVTTFYNCFEVCRSLTSIPAGLFDNCPGVTDFSGCFYYCSNLTSIPNGLFDNCPDVTSFFNCFLYCSKLTSIPEGLFVNCPNVFDFQNCFYGCSGLTSIPNGLFDNCPKVKMFNACFSGCSNLSGSTPKDPDGGELWERAGKEGYPASVTGAHCFRMCAGLYNYDEIPEDWK